MRIAALIFIRSGYNLAIFGAIFAVLSFMRTERFRQRTGVSPWHIPPIVWAVGSFFIAIFGTLLSVIACATTKVPGATGGSSGSGWGPVQRRAGAIRGPRATAPRGYGAPGSFPNPGTDPGPGPVLGYGSPGAGPRASSPGPPVPGAARPGWHPDPVGRHQHRYWDGTEWTEHIANNGASGVDPV